MHRQLLIYLIVFLVIALKSDASFNPAITFPRNGSASCVDYDNDGYPDLIIGLTIYHNNGNGKFLQVGSVPATVDPNGVSCGPTAWVDFDSDGVRDVLVFGNGPNSRTDSNDNGIGHPTDRIIRITGFANGVPILADHFDILGWDVPYTDQTAPETLMTNPNATYAVAIADINRDGKPDVYLGRGRLGDLIRDNNSEWYGKDWLVKNISYPGAIQMTDISNDVGLTRDNQYCPDILSYRQFRNTDGLGAADYNYDGYPDFFAATYRCKCNTFWKGGPGDKHGFSIINATDQHNCQSSTGLNLTNIEQGDVLHGCGVYWFDYDNDGYLDLMEARVSHFVKVGGLRLWHNNKDGTFTNVSNLLPQIQNAYSSQHYRCIAAGDYDNDGDLDVYVTRYAYGPVKYRNDLPAYFRGRMLRNNLVETGNPSFTDITAAENLDNSSHVDTWGTCFIDYNNDGKLDLFTIQGFASADAVDELWKNDGQWTGHWLDINLIPPKEVGGIRINRDAIGAVLQIWIDKNRNNLRDSGEILTRQQMGCTTGSSLWQGPTPLHFGLGPYTTGNVPIKGRVFWPGVVDHDKNPIWVDFDIPGVDLAITVTGGTAPSGIPGMPAPKGTYSGTSVTFKWEPADDLGSGVAGYNCQIGTSPDGCDVFNSNIGNKLSITINGQNKITYYCRVQSVDNAGSVTYWSASSDGVTVDTESPTGSVVINGGVEYSNNNSVTLTLSAQDTGSGVCRMRFSQDGISWNEWEPYSTSKTWQLPVGDGVKHVYVMYSDIIGNASQAVDDTIILDQTPPTPGKASSPGVAQDVPINISYSDASDAQSDLKQVKLWCKKGLAGKWVAASCAPQNLSNSTFEFMDITGQDTYYFDLVAEDKAGNQSSLPTGDGQASTIYTGAVPYSIDAAKAYTGDVAVSVSGAVTAVFEDYFYIEAVDRSVGIRVIKPSHEMSVKNTIQVKGNVLTFPTGERAINAISIKDLHIPTLIYPLGMNNASLGGGTIGAQAGVSGGNGLNNIGLLVRTSGRVSNINANTFRIDDGSGVGLDAVVTSGVSLPANDSYVAVTGIVSCSKDQKGSIYRVILVTSCTVY